MKTNNFTKIMQQEHEDKSALQVIFDERVKRSVIVRQIAVTKSSYITVPITSPRLLVQELSKWTIRRMINEEHYVKGNLHAHVEDDSLYLLREQNWLTDGPTLVSLRRIEDILNSGKPGRN